MEILELLKRQFGQQTQLLEKRPGVMQLLAPFYHEDGDMVEVFVEVPSAEGKPIRVSDHGMTLMRLSYAFDIDTPNKERIFRRILSENGIAESGGELYVESYPKDLHASVTRFAQTVAKVSNMQLYKRETIESLFFEMLDDIINAKLREYQPRQRVCPMGGRTDLEVDYTFDVKPRPIYLFGVRDNAKARLAAISCLEFRVAALPFRSVVVHEDFERLSKNDRTRITSAADKQFPTTEDFREKAKEFFERSCLAPDMTG